MDYETDMDEDLRLAISLSKNELLVSSHKTRVTTEEDDYLYALKLSRELNSPSTSTSTFSSDVARQDSDFQFAQRLTQTENEIASKKDNTSHVDQDYLLAVLLATEEKGEWSHEAKKVKTENVFPDDIDDSDYDVALRSAKSESSYSPKASYSAVNDANGKYSEPVFDSEIDDRDLLLVAQLYETDDLDVEPVNVSSVANNARVKRTQNEVSMKT